jgi:hypothetical protein
MDVDSIEPGLDFASVLQEHVKQCDAVLAIIGPRWLTATDEQGRRRLDDPHDFVRIEIETALNEDKRVIPILVGEGRMPRPEELPEALRPLARRNAVRLTHERFSSDAQSLVKSLEKALEDAASRRQPQQQGLVQEPATKRMQRRTLALGGGLGLAAIAAALWMLWPLLHAPASSDKRESGAEQVTEPAPVSVQAVFEKHNLLGTFRSDCGVPITADNIFYIHRALDAQHVQSEQMSGAMVRDWLVVLDTAREISPDMLAISGVLTGRIGGRHFNNKPAAGIWRLESNRLLQWEGTIDGEKTIADGKLVSNGSQLPWLHRCGG